MSIALNLARSTLAMPLRLGPLLRPMSTQGTDVIAKSSPSIFAPNPYFDVCPPDQLRQVLGPLVRLTQSFNQYPFQTPGIFNTTTFTDTSSFVVNGFDGTTSGPLDLPTLISHQQDMLLRATPRAQHPFAHALLSAIFTGSVNVVRSVIDGTSASMRAALLLTRFNGSRLSFAHMNAIFNTDVVAQRDIHRVLCDHAPELENGLTLGGAAPRHFVETPYCPNMSVDHLFLSSDPSAGRVLRVETNSQFNDLMQGWFGISSLYQGTTLTQTARLQALYYSTVPGGVINSFHLLSFGYDKDLPRTAFQNTPPDLCIVRDPLLPAGGVGVVALSDISVGDVIRFYEGPCCAPIMNLSADGLSYSMVMSNAGSSYLMCSPDGLIPGVLAGNEAIYINTGPADTHNCAVIPTIKNGIPSAVLIATDHIPAGRQLTYAYNPRNTVAGAAQAPIHLTRDFPGLKGPS